MHKLFCYLFILNMLRKIIVKIIPKEKIINSLNDYFK